MNERIKSLLERAEYQAQKQSGSDWEIHVEPSREQIFEKFAELIVRECMSVADLPKNPSGQWDHLESSEVIAKHFGVEE
jgi:hypothetical protein